MTDITEHMEEARQIAAQCWCDDETAHIEMDTTLAEAVAKRIASWMDTSAMFSRSTDFYQSLLDECAKHLGHEVFTADDGTVSDCPLRLKIPPAVKQLADRLAESERQLAEYKRRDTKFKQLSDKAKTKSAYWDEAVKVDIEALQGRLAESERREAVLRRTIHYTKDRLHLLALNAEQASYGRDFSMSAVARELDSLSASIAALAATEQEGKG